ncbi:MAG: hypothetical protein J6X69_07205 [Bacteroidales bacterium]|nr:hypothetical protein [Bacteroidales bacterium]
MNSFLKSAFLLSLAALLSTACIKENLVPRSVEPGEDARVEEIHFKWNKVRTIVSSSISIPVKLILMDDGTEYTDPALLEWSVSNDKMATITQEGKLTTKTTTGELTVTAQADGVSATIPVYITSGVSTTGIDKTAFTLFDKGCGVEDNYGAFNIVPQGFDITRDGKVYYLRVSNAENCKFRMFLNRVQPNASTFHSGTEACIECHFFGHGTNFSIEEDGDDKYVWIATWGNKVTSEDPQKNKQYWNEQIIGRFKFQDGSSVQPKDVPDYFYIGQRRDIHVAIDTEGDDLMVYYTDGDPVTPRHFVIYSLSEAMKAPLRNKTLSSLTYGGDGSDVEEVTDSPTLKVHDLTKITKKAEFGFQGQAQAQAYVEGGGDPSDPEALSYYNYQGFEIHDGAIYFYEGEGQYKTSDKSHAYITVFNYAGQVIEKRTKVNIAEDWNALESNGITSNGYMEGEGLKVRNGFLYVCLGSNPDGYSRGNIFKFNVAKLK